jgi:hypothetical protein
MTKRHENLWLQGKELDERVLKYWADPPEPFQENPTINRKKSEAIASEIVSLFSATAVMKMTHYRC